MLKKDDFYTSDDYPGSKEKLSIWDNISENIKPKRNLIFQISDMRSFYFGIAAAAVVFFTMIGVYTTARQVLYNMKPEELKLDGAYQSAIHEFEKVVPSVVSTISHTRSEKDFYELKKQQINYIDNAIAQMRYETGTNDLSPLKQSRLRQLYVAKLKVLQEIVDRGDIEL